MAKYTTISISFMLIYLVCGGIVKGQGNLNDLPNHTENTMEHSDQRDGKLFSLFSIVQFKNEGCRSNLQSGLSTASGGYRNGTCFTSNECSNKGGSANGGCAAGFGVCCVFILEESGSTVTQNCTYIRNPGFPNAYGSTTQASYTIQKCSCDVCQVRLDFETFLTNGPSGTGENVPTPVVGATTGAACQDSLIITGTALTTSGGNAVPTICGDNSRQHVYVDMGTGCSNTVSLTMSFASAATGTRQWDIKATQIQCGAAWAAEPGCLQYLTGTTGRFETFNYPDSNSGHLSNQDYSYCIRQEQGYCCIQYTVCRDQCQNVINSKGVPDMTCEGFSPGNTDAAVIVNAMVDSQCTNDYLVIRGFSATCISAISAPGYTRNRLCGYYMTTDSTTAIVTTADGPSKMQICDCSQPFRVDWYSDALSDKEAAGTATNDANEQSRGFCWEYTQLPC